MPSVLNKEKMHLGSAKLEILEHQMLTSILLPLISTPSQKLLNSNDWSQIGVVMVAYKSKFGPKWIEQNPTLTISNLSDILISLILPISW